MGITINWWLTQAQLQAALNPLYERIDDMATVMEQLVQEVADMRTVEQSAVALLDGLKASLDAAIAAGDMTAVAQAVADLDAQKAELAAAITRNTPAAPAP